MVLASRYCCEYVCLRCRCRSATSRAVTAAAAAILHPSKLGVVFKVEVSGDTFPQAPGSGVLAGSFHRRQLVF